MYYAFTHREVEKFYVDPKHGTTIDDLLDWQPNLTFVCAPTPMADSGFIDASIVEDAVLKLLEHTTGGVVVKSTITPEIVDRMYCSICEKFNHNTKDCYKKQVEGVSGDINFDLGAKIGEKDAYALSMLMDIVNAGESSRLYQRLVDKDQIAVQASGGFQSLMEYGFARYAAENFTLCRPVAPDGNVPCSASTCSTPLASITLTVSSCSPTATSISARHCAQASPE